MGISVTIRNHCPSTSGNLPVTIPVTIVIIFVLLYISWRYSWLRPSPFFDLPVTIFVTIFAIITAWLRA